ncbi:MAG: TolB protein, partial [Maricaulis maris]
MTRILVLFAALLALIGWSAASDAQEPLRVDVTQGNLDPMPIAVPDFVGASDEALRRGADITRVVANDLASSGLFAPVDQDAFIEDIANIDLRPRFS